MDSHRQNQVASFTDAWIETCAAMARFWRLRRIFYRCVDWNQKSDIELVKGKVASFTDAWIETQSRTVFEIPCWVASFTDAWIETINDAGHEVTTVSHLLQMRGLKRPFEHECKQNQ